MSKALWVIFSILVIVVILWFNKQRIVSHFLSKDFGIPVTMKKCDLSFKGVKFHDFKITNPPRSKTRVALSSKIIDISTTLKDLKGERMTFNAITLDEIFIGVEYYDPLGKKNNWATIMNTKAKGKKRKKEKKYLIKKLSLNNISVVLTYMDGKKKTFSKIKHLEFRNLTEDTGFPVDKIEKAVFHTILKEIFLKFNLKTLLDTLKPKKLIPELLKFPFIGEQKLPSQPSKEKI